MLSVLHSPRRRRVLGVIGSLVAIAAMTSVAVVVASRSSAETQADPPQTLHIPASATAGIQPFLAPAAPTTSTATTSTTALPSATAVASAGSPGAPRTNGSQTGSPPVAGGAGGNGASSASTPSGCSPGGAPTNAYAVGDSIMIDYQQPLESCIPGIQVDAAVSRWWSQGEDVMRPVMAGTTPGAVIVGLGSNGPITDADFDAMMSIVGKAPIVAFVNVHVDQPWQDQVNTVLANGVHRYPNAVLVDWQSLATQHPEWFGSDGTHLAINGPGAQALANLIASKV